MWHAGMKLDPSTLSRRDKYFLLTTCVVPRPIAWVGTVAPDGTPNLAPYSFFGGVCTDPPTVMVSVGRRRGQRKDTAVNLLDNGEGVIHIVTAPLAEQMVKTSGEYASHVDELAHVGLTPGSSERVAPSRVSEAAVAMEAKVVHHQEVGNGPVDLFLMEIVLVHLADEVLVDGLPDPRRLQAVGRLGKQAYAHVKDPYDISRPSAEEVAAAGAAGQRG